MKRKIVRLFMQPITLLLSGLVGAFIILLIVFVMVLESRPDPHVWHLGELDDEFTAPSLAALPPATL